LTACICKNMRNPLDSECMQNCTFYMTREARSSTGTVAGFQPWLWYPFTSGAGWVRVSKAGNHTQRLGRGGNHIMIGLAALPWYVLGRGGNFVLRI